MLKSPGLWNQFKTNRKKQEKRDELVNSLRIKCKKDGPHHLNTCTQYLKIFSLSPLPLFHSHPFTLCRRFSCWPGKGMRKRDQQMETPGTNLTYYLRTMQHNYTWAQLELADDLPSSPGFCPNVLNTGYMEPEWVSPMTSHWPHECWLSNVPHVYLQVHEYQCLLTLSSVSIYAQHAMLDFICV